MDCLHLVTRPPWPGRFPVAAVVVAAVAVVAVVVVVVVVVVVDAVSVAVAATVKTSRWYLDLAQLAESGFPQRQGCPLRLHR